MRLLLTECSGSWRVSRAAATSVTCWPSTTANNLPPTSSTLSRKSSPAAAVAEVTACRRDGIGAGQVLATVPLSLVRAAAADYATNHGARRRSYDNQQTVSIHTCDNLTTTRRFTEQTPDDIVITMATRHVC